MLSINGETEHFDVQAVVYSLTYFVGGKMHEIFPSVPLNYSVFSL